MSAAITIADEAVDLEIRIESVGISNAELDKSTRQLASELRRLPHESVGILSDQVPKPDAYATPLATEGAVAMSVRATILPRVLELLQTGPLARDGRRVKVKGPHGVDLDCAGPISREIVDAWLNGVVKKSRIPAQADPGMSIEEMKDFVRKHFDDFINGKNSEAALRNFSADFLDHDGATGESIGPEPAKLMIEGLFQQYPDLHVTVEDILEARETR
jgi:hypothetical protein